ncbi:uncharacterized protein [Pseudochaenichthys georgianus]|uniref:uncharacterized protein n=1 Tax=Pseudochaenichthys georgianus TaxID=52239 RepID=UPI0039C2D6E1
MMSLGGQGGYRGFLPLESVLHSLETSVSKAASSESLEQGTVSDSNQKRKGVMQKVNPVKSSTQGPRSDPPDDSADPPEAGNELQDKQNPWKIAGMMQKVNPFKSSQPKDNQPLHDDLSSSSGSLDNTNVSEKQNPGMFKGMMQKVNPFKSHTQTPGEECQIDSSSALMTPVRFTSIWYADVDPVLEVKGPPAEAPRKSTMVCQRFRSACIHA